MRWTEKEERFLIENYTKAERFSEIIDKLKRSKKSIRHKASRLNLYRPDYRKEIKKRTPRKIIEKRYYERNKEKLYQRKKQRIDEQKEELRKLLGGKCKICGYDKCSSALEFHHNSGKKEGHICKMIKNSAKQKSLKEIKKCILLCANCHREAHNKGA